MHQWQMFVRPPRRPYGGGHEHHQGEQSADAEREEGQGNEHGAGFPGMKQNQNTIYTMMEMALEMMKEFFLPILRDRKAMTEMTSKVAMHSLCKGLQSKESLKRWRRSSMFCFWSELGAATGVRRGAEVVRGHARCLAVVPFGTRETGGLEDLFDDQVHGIVIELDIVWVKPDKVAA